MKFKNYLRIIFSFFKMIVGLSVSAYSPYFGAGMQLRLVPGVPVP
ncbi:hypothetical protein BH20BAC1_BH20BAC1_04230 [soil metagenome]